MDSLVNSPHKGAPAPEPLEARVAAVGVALTRSLGALLEEIPGAPHGPQNLARTLSLDKVLTSRLLKCLRSADPIAVVHHAPGPDPLRRFVRSAKRLGIDAARVRDALAAVDAFEELIRAEAGDRSALGAMIAGWLPEARAEFELRRKQSAFKALSELKGASSDVTVATALLAPSRSGEKIDVVWIFGVLGLRRWREDVRVRFATRRMVEGGEPRRPTSLRGAPVEGLADLRLDAFCSAPPTPLEVRRSGDCVHYLIGGHDFGPRSPGDFIYAEANFEEMARYVPSERRRKGYTFAQLPVPTKALLYDVLVHDEIYPDSAPELVIYDTSQDGVADINDRSRDIDRWDMAEAVEDLGHGLEAFRSAAVPHYVDLLRHVLDEVGWNAESFRGYRVEVDYPVYCTQIAMTFDPPPPNPA